MAFNYRSTLRELPRLHDRARSFRDGFALELWSYIDKAVRDR
jgi:hypothetical protein